jgi:spermidine synthase
MRVTRTRGGVRLSQHGVVVCEMRTSPGATHSVFDVLAALMAVLAPAGRVGVLGFSGGGLMAPLRRLGAQGPVEAVDLDDAAHRLFRRHCGGWAGVVQWEQADALAWLRRQSGKFDLLLEDLSVPEGDDVHKPAVSWRGLPEAMRRRLRPRGVAVFNLLPPGGPWLARMHRIADLFGPGQACVVRFEEYENCVLVAGRAVPSARRLGAWLRAALRRLGSRQAGRVQVRQLRRRTPLRR